MKGYAFALLACVAVGLAGCATTTPVVSIGNGHYEVAGKSATALASEGDEKVRIIQVANDYCARTGQKALIENADGQNGQIGNLFQPGRTANADVVFSCQ